MNFDPIRLRSVHLVPLSAFDAKDAFNSEVQAEHIRRMRTAGIEVFLPAAGTSEFHSLSADEIVEIVRMTREVAGPESTIFAPVGLQIAHAIDVGRRSLEAGADGVLFMPFVHPYVSDEGAMAYYRTVMGTLRCPAILYRKAAVPSDELLLKLSRDPRVVGFKYAVNDLPALRTTILTDTRSGRTQSEWLCGSAERFAPFHMLAGATGFTTGAGNVCPHLVLAMHAALAAGQWDEGLRLQAVLLPIENYRARAGDSFNISMLKHALNHTGLDFGPPRPPQRILTDEQRAEIDELLEPILAAETELATKTSD